MPKNTVSPLRIQEVGIDLFIQPALRAAAEQLIALAKAEAERATAANAGNLSQRFLILARDIEVPLSGNYYVRATPLRSNGDTIAAGEQARYRVHPA
jgi:hypothetical protein